jgi:hypothetical protein
MMIGGAACSSPGALADTTVTRGPARVHLLELYSSEGCSSCPPAEAWFSKLKRDPGLWKSVVPVEFHVDYWNSLGWPDALSSPAFTERQRNYASSWGADNVYTPEFVLDGAEWRRGSLDSIPTTGASGLLKVVVQAGGRVAITFEPGSGSTGSWEVHAALLGMDLSSDVTAGENNGRRLQHDFAVLSLQSSALPEDSTSVNLILPSEKIQPGHAAIAVWVTKKGEQTPVQAAGGFL